MSTLPGHHKLRDPVPPWIGRHVDLPKIGYSGKPWLDKAWEDYAECREVDEPDILYPTDDPDRGERTKRAKALCKACDVSDACTEAAIARGEKDGIWGGRFAGTLINERSRRNQQHLALITGGTAA